MKIIYLLFSFLFFATPLRAAVPERMIFKVDGVERHALVFAPTAGGHAKSPLIFGFHGHGGSPEASVRGMAFQNAWPDALVVYPQGLPIATNVDPQGIKPGWQRSAGEVGDRDLKFVDQMVATLREKYSIDDNRIFAVGFSNGAFFTYLLWAQRPQLFTGFAPVAGLFTFAGEPKVPKPAVLIGGERDQLVKIDKLQVAMRAVRRLNGCAEQGEACGPLCTRFASSKNAPLVNVIHPNGHIYPPRATQVIVDFFKTLPR